MSLRILQHARAWVDSPGVAGHLSPPAWEEHFQHLKPTTIPSALPHPDVLRDGKE